MLRLARASGIFGVCAIVTSRPDRFRSTLRRDVTRFGRAALLAATNPELELRSIRPRRLNLERLQRSHRVRVLVPPGGDVNAAGFRDRLRRDLRPDLAFSFYVGTIFHRPLLESFEQVVNYHDSLLPMHRGRGATSFSIYDGDPATGFTFHRMTEGIDAGPVLVQGSIALSARLGLDAVHRRKIVAAVHAMPELFASVAANDPGRPQEGPVSYHSAHDVSEIRHVERPESHAAHELQRRISAFGTVFLTIGGTRYPATRLRPAAPGLPLAFRTADGQTLAPDRFRYLPRMLYDLGEHRRLRHVGEPGSVAAP